jgi:hypothetical protein
MPSLGELEDFLGLLEQTLVVLRRLAAGEELLCPFDADEFFCAKKRANGKTPHAGWPICHCRTIA